MIKLRFWGQKFISDYQSKLNIITKVLRRERLEGQALKGNMIAEGERRVWKNLHG